MNYNKNQLLKERNRRLSLRSTRKFKSTNKIWNDLKLNQSWSIGYLTTLFKKQNFINIADWEIFYYKSGEERLMKINKLPPHKQNLLKRITFVPNMKEMSYLTKQEISLNKYYGRTETELIEIGKYMHKEICKRGNPLSIRLDECIDFVKIRVIDEISMGIERELNTIKELERIFPNLRFKQVPVEIDSKYAIDCEVYNQNDRILALQIKSNAYKINNSDILNDTKKFNEEKNTNYKSKYGVDVLYVYSEINGNILNTEIFDLINNLSQ